MLAVLALLALAATPASAHSELVSSSPEDGAVLAAAPDRVVLRFSEDIRDQGSAVVVTDADQARVDDPGSLVISGPRVTVALDDTVGSGAYTVAYRVVSADGHVIGGAITYTLDLPTQETPAATSSPPASGTPTPSVSRTVPPSPEPASDADEDGSAVPWPAIALGGAALAAAAVVVARARRHRG